MLELKLSKSELSDPKVQKALLQLIQSLSAQKQPLARVESFNSESNSKQGKRGRVAGKRRNAASTKAIGKAGDKQKVFQSIIQEAGRISSDELTERMQSYFPSFSAKGIGGIVGSIKRWSGAPSFSSEKDESGKLFFSWTGDSQSEVAKPKSTQSEETVDSQGGEVDQLISSLEGQQAKRLCSLIKERGTIEATAISKSIKVKKNQLPGLARQVAKHFRESGAQPPFLVEGESYRWTAETSL